MVRNRFPVPNPPPEAQHVVVWIKTLLPSTSDRVGHKGAVRKLLDSTSTVALPGLDYDVRWNQSWRTDPWESLTVDEAEQLIHEADDIVTVAAGLSMHRNGRIRELAALTVPCRGTRGRASHSSGDRFGRGRPSNDLRARIEEQLHDPSARHAVEAGAVSPSRSVRVGAAFLAELGVELFEEARIDPYLPSGAWLADSSSQPSPTRFLRSVWCTRSD